jgi:hypothetical protein
VTPDEPALVAASQQIDRLEAARMYALARFIAAAGHRADGWPTPAAWVRSRFAVGPSETARLCARARRMTAWPVLGEAWVAGRVTGAQVEAVCRLVPRPLVDLYAEHDAEVSPLLAGLSLSDTTVAVREWVARAEAHQSPDPAGLGEVETRPAELFLARSIDDGGMVNASLDPTTTTLVETALRVAERPNGPGEVRTAAQRRAEALGAIARSYLDHHERRDARPGRQHPHVLVVVDLPDLYAACLRGAGITDAAELDAHVAANQLSAVEAAFMRDALVHASGDLRTLDGHRLQASTVTELFGPGTTMARLLTARGQVLDHGRSVRLAGPTLRDAVLARDGTCRYPGCHSPAVWADTHHVRHWRRGGSTSVTNLVALCGGHHGLVHSKGWDLSVAADGTVTFVDPAGAELRSPPPRRHRPPPLPLHLPALDALRPPRARPPTHREHATQTESVDLPESAAADDELDVEASDRLIRRRVQQLVRAA